MKKPRPATIAAAPPLSRRLAADPLAACTVCGVASTEFEAWAEADERDRVTSASHRIFLAIGKDHAKCRAELDAHPRLYVNVRGEPGSFPLLCGACTFRHGTACTHPDLTTNGGSGLRVGLDPLATRVVCMLTRGGGGRPMAAALDCAGQRLRGEA